MQPPRYPSMKPAPATSNLPVPVIGDPTRTLHFPQLGTSGSFLNLTLPINNSSLSSPLSSFPPTPSSSTLSSSCVCISYLRLNPSPTYSLFPVFLLGITSPKENEDRIRSHLARRSRGRGSSPEYPMLRMAPSPGFSQLISC